MRYWMLRRLDRWVCPLGIGGDVVLMWRDQLDLDLRRRYMSLLSSIGRTYLLRRQFASYWSVPYP